MSDTTEKEFEPNEEFLEILISMGLSKDIATEVSS